MVTASAIPYSASAAEMCYQDDIGRIVKRRRPGYDEVPCPEEGSTQGPTPADNAPATPSARPDAPKRQEDTGRAQRRRVIERAPPASVSPIPRPGLTDYVEAVPMPDRWRIVDTLGYKERWWDPYNRNVLKADKPVMGDDWFFNLSMIADTVGEIREVATPVGAISTNNPGGNDVFGSADQMALAQTLTTEFVLYKGNTVFKPPDWEFRLTPALSYTYTEFDEVQSANADPRQGLTRDEAATQLGWSSATVKRRLARARELLDRRLRTRGIGLSAALAPALMTISSPASAGR